MTIRKPRMSYTHVTGFLAMHRTRQSVHYASPLERDFLIRQDFDQDLISATHEPLTVMNSTSSRTWRQYTPDYLLQYAPGSDRPPLLVEVKPREVLQRDWPTWRLKFKAALKLSSEMGYRFKVMDETRIRLPDLAALSFLRRYISPAPDQERVDRLRSALPDRSRVTVTAWLGQAMVSEEHRPSFLPIAWHLIATGEVATDLTQPIDRDSTVWQRGNEG